MSEVVKLIECFRSFQGEGPDSGRSMYILRFKTCNLKCSWCDTKVKMRISAEAPYSLDQIQQLLDESGAGILVTGGEPTVPAHFPDCIKLLNNINYPIANVESNGYNLDSLFEFADKDKPIKFIYSPKIFSNSDLKQAQLLTPGFLEDDRVFVKIVYEPGNFELVEYLEWLSNLNGYHQRVYLMPEGVTRADLIRNSEQVFDAAEKYKFNFSSRDHVIYGFI